MTDLPPDGAGSPDGGSSPERWRLLALPPVPADALPAMLDEALPGLPVDVVVPEERSRDGLRAAVADADLLLGDWSHELVLGTDDLAVAEHLAFVQQPSVGVDGYDVDALADAGVPLANAAGANSVSVAEWCLGATLALVRHLVWADAQVRAGQWPPLEQLTGRGSAELSGRRVGLVGFGAIGAACADRFAALGCPVSYWSRRRRPPEEEHGASYRDLDELVAASEVLVVVVALGEQTRGLLGAELLARLPAGALVVNAARGGIVDEAALAEAIAQERLGGAALDVYETEPLPADSPLRASDRVLLSPHAAGATVQAQERIVRQSTANLRRVIEGEAPVDVVNGVEGPVTRRR
jgi:phosphoglycerate dehydrogenase-like enzyme